MMLAFTPPCEACGATPTMLLHLRGQPLGFLCRSHADELMVALSTTVPADEGARGLAMWREDSAAYFEAVTNAR